MRTTKESEHRGGGGVGWHSRFVHACLVLVPRNDKRVASSSLVSRARTTVAKSGGMCERQARENQTTTIYRCQELSARDGTRDTVYHPLPRVARLSGRLTGKNCGYNIAAQHKKTAYTRAADTPCSPVPAIANNTFRFKRTTRTTRPFVKAKKTKHF